jgi:hypothetical protein
LAVASCTLVTAAADWPQWRGPQRTGISLETGLLKEWPAQGPRLLWLQPRRAAGQPGPTGAAKAWPHPVVANGRLYIRDLGTLWSYDVRSGQR